MNEQDGITSNKYVTASLWGKIVPNEKSKKSSDNCFRWYAQMDNVLKLMTDYMPKTKL